jgi:glutamyl/glutaminyl-tRNA synthetase
MIVGRFAPSTTGTAHPGTLLAALLCWLDARAAGGRIGLRLEDLDPQRSTPQRGRQLRDDLRWFGLDWDFEVTQSERSADHTAALDALAQAGLLYPCACSRSQLRESALRASDGSFVYPGTCRGRELPSAGWRATREALRVRMQVAIGELTDESGTRLAGGSQIPSDPIVRRRDGSVAYQLATVVDDAAQGVTRIVRGRDLASSTALQVALQQLLKLPTPVYRHHLLLLEERGDKLAKLHGAVGASELRAHYSADGLCGLLAWGAGLLPEPLPMRPQALVEGFDWRSVFDEDRVVRWSGSELELVG